MHMKGQVLDGHIETCLVKDNADKVRGKHVIGHGLWADKACTGHSATIAKPGRTEKYKATHLAVAALLAVLRGTAVCQSSGCLLRHNRVAVGEVIPQHLAPDQLITRCLCSITQWQDSSTVHPCGISSSEMYQVLAVHTMLTACLSGYGLADETAHRAHAMTATAAVDHKSLGTTW
mgnify:CR=1 FL=1